MKKLFTEAVRLLDMGKSFVLATILESSGSVPRGSGACMIILRDGSIFGTVGGGAIEAGIINAAPGIFDEKHTRIIEMVLDGNDAVAVGMICGGSATAELEYIDVIPENIERFKCLLKESDDDTVYIFGAGHCGEALSPLLTFVGFSVVVIDDRSEFANNARFPDADEILVPKSMELVFDEARFGDKSYIVIVTRGHKYDELVLSCALRTEAGYIGMIGSRKKRDTIYKNLLASEYTKKDLSRVYSPIGIPIGDETPEEIAVSITAQLIKVRADRRPGGGK